MRDKNDLPCHWCGGSTSLSYYAGAHKLTCHKCDKYSFDEEEIESVLSMTASPVFKQKTPVIDEKFEPLRGIIKPLEERNISERATEFYQVETLYGEDDVEYARSYLGYDTNGEAVAQKIKSSTGDKRMKWLGSHGDAGLFGSHVVPQGGKYITITEGEEDCLAVWDALYDRNGHKFPPAVVSVKDGCGGAVRDCKNQWEYLNSFENIIVMFDGDSIGQETARKVAKLFPFKVSIVNFPKARKNDDGKWEMKDASDYKKSGLDKELISMWFDAERYVPKGVRTFKSLWDDMTKEDSNTVVPFPWDGVNELAYGMITGKMDVFKAPPKIGKTSVMSELVMHIRDTTDYNIGVIFLENTTKEVGLKFCGIRANLPLDRPNVPKDWDMIKEIHSDISEDDRITVFDPEDERTAENVFTKIKYFVKAHDCRYIFLDHASMLAYQSENQDERKFLDKLFADLKAMTTSLDIYLGVVIHVNDDGKTRGSRAPVQLCDRLYALHRDKMNDDPIVANTTEFIVEENRYGSSGLGSLIYYDQDTGRMKELDKEFIAEQEAAKEKDVTFDD